METIHLILTEKWYDMIDAGLKPEEYRELSTYWITRLSNAIKRGASTVTFSRAYQKGRLMVFEKKHIAIGTGNPDWGAKPGKVYFKIKLGKRLS